MPRLIIPVSAALFAVEASADVIVRTEALIQDLGAPIYMVRDRATRELANRGPAVLREVQAAAASDDPEVRYRAGSLLTNAVFGIRPEWPAELGKRILGIEQMRPGSRVDLLEAVAGRYGGEAVWLLLARMESTAPEESAGAERLLGAISSTGAAGRVAAFLTAPATRGQRRACLWAYDVLGQPHETLRIFEGSRAAAPELALAVTSCVARLRALHVRGEWEDLARQAADCSEALPRELRFAYLQVGGLTGMGRTNEAERVLDRIAAMQLASQAPHLDAARFLDEIGLPDLATREWQRITEIPPSRTAPAAEAHYALGRRHKEAGRNRRALEEMTAGSRCFPLWPDPGTAGLTQQRFLDEIAILKPLVERQEAAELPRLQPRLEASMVFTRGDSGDLDRRLPACTVTRGVMPYSLWSPSIGDQMNRPVRYEARTRSILFEGTGAVYRVVVGLAPSNGVGDVAVRFPDCFLLCRVDFDRGTVDSSTLYQWDYYLRLIPGPEMAAWSNVTVVVSGKTNDWQRIQKGVRFLDAVASPSINLTFDVTSRDPSLRGTLGVQCPVLIEGTDPRGERKRVSYMTRVVLPPLPAGFRRPLIPPEAAGPPAKP